MDAYSIASTTNDWMSIIYMVVYIPLIIPATWALDRYGLRFAIVIASAGNAVGAIVKWISISYIREFWLAFIGQTIAAIAQLYVLTIPPALAGDWFPANEVSTACSLGVFANQCGAAIGFLVPPLFSQNATTKFSTDVLRSNYTTYGNLDTLYFAGAMLCCVIACAVTLFFRSEPKHPPSQASLNVKRGNEAMGFAESFSTHFKSMMRMLADRDVLFLTLSYGLNTGIYYALGTLLAKFVIRYCNAGYFGAGYEGYIGLTVILAGLVGAVAAGWWLDRSRTYRLTTIGMYAATLVSMAFYTAAPYTQSIEVMFVAAGLLGLTMTGYLPVGFELGVELSYPEPEASSSGLVNASAQLFGIIFTYGLGALMGEGSETKPVLYSNIIAIVGLSIGMVFTMLIKVRLRRQEHENVA